MAETARQLMVSRCFPLWLKTESGLNLHHTYTIKLLVETVYGTFLADWIINLSQFDFNQKIDQSAFSISPN